MFKFHPILKSVLWGGNRIPAFKRIDTNQQHIGESWEISGVSGNESVVADGPDAGLTLPELIARYRDALVGVDVYARFGNEFPLLVKLIDAEQNLSLQVHPDDALASLRHGCQGKTEMWYLINTQPQAEILAGFEREITSDDYERMVADGSILQAVRHHEAHDGDVFFLPPGTIHSIGAGNLLAEIQQTSDITYRVYDYDRRDALGNKRQLHTALARQALDYTTGDNYTREYDRNAPGLTTLVECNRFVVSRLQCDGDDTLPLAAVKSFVIVVCVDGEAQLTDDSELNPTDGGNPAVSIARGQTVLIPASSTSLHIDGKTTLLTAWMP